MASLSPPPPPSTSNPLTTSSTSKAEDEEEIDILSSVLNLENTYYTTGYAEGLIAGKQQGRLEGRVYGLERGFEKYKLLGNISGRTKVWASRINSSSPSSYSTPTPPTPPTSTTTTTQTLNDDSTIPPSSLPTNPTQLRRPLPPLLTPITNQRYIRHVDVLRTEILSDIPIRNEDEDVDDVDDRLRRGKGKCVVLCKVLGEVGVSVDDDGGVTGGAAGVSRGGLQSWD